MVVDEVAISFGRLNDCVKILSTQSSGKLSVMHILGDMGNETE